MVTQSESFENSQNEFFRAMRSLKIGSLLHQAGIRKQSVFSCLKLFTDLLLLVFQGKNLYQFLNSKRSLDSPSRSCYQRFLSESSFNWSTFLLSLSSKVIAFLSTLTKSSRINVLILDDSVYHRNRSKKPELLVRVFDHVSHRFVKGYCMLSLG